MKKVLTLILVAIVIAAGCLSSPEKSPETKTSTPTASTKEGFLAEIGIIAPSDPLCGMDPNSSIAGFIKPLKEKYSIVPARPDFPVPEGSLANKTFKVSNAYVGVFAYPDSYSAAEALGALKKKLATIGNATGRDKWLGRDALYSAFGAYFDGFYFIVILKVPYDEEWPDMAEYTLNKLMFSMMWVGPSPGKMLGLFMHTRIENRTGRSKIFSGDLLSASGFTPEGAGIEVAVYRRGCGGEVYVTLEERIKGLGFREKPLPPLKSRDPAGEIVQRAYFEGNGSVYIELYNGPGMDRVMLLYGNESAVKATVMAMWGTEETSRQVD